MLSIYDKDYFDKVRQFAESVGKMEQLQSKLDYLNSYADHENKGLTKCILGRDYAPYSFEFVMMRLKDGEYERWFNGGLIFHGDHDRGGDGSAPTFSVCLTPTDGWEIHT